jgi:hypothetical protein
LVSFINIIFIAQNVQKQYGKMGNEPHFYFSRLLKNTHLICDSKGEGLSTPQQFVFELTARPGAFDLNGKQAALQRLRYGCCRAGLSDKVRKSLPFYRFRIILLWLKSPSPLEPLNSLENYFFNNLLVP